MESRAVQVYWNAAGRRDVCNHVPPSHQAHTGFGVALDAAETDLNQSLHANTSTASARHPSLFSPTATSARSSKSAVHYVQSRKCGDNFGGTQAQLPSAVVAAKTSATRPFFSSAASVRHPAVSVPSKALQSYSSVVTIPSSAVATSLSSMNGVSARHPVLRSRSIPALQQQSLQYLGILSSDNNNVQSCFFDSRSSSAEPRKDEPQLRASGSSAVQPPGSAASLPNGNRLVTSSTMPLPVAATALIRCFSDKALYARPRSASFTYTSLSDSQLAEPSQEWAQVEAVVKNSSLTTQSQRLDTVNNSAVRDPELFSHSDRSRSSSTPPPDFGSKVKEPGQVAVDDALVKAARYTRSGSASLVSRQQLQQALGVPPSRAAQTLTRGYHLDVSEADHSGSTSGRLCEADQTSEGAETGIPFTPQAAAGAAGIEIGPAAGEWNLPRIQQRILAARLQAQVRQHFTSAVEILVSVQMSLDADYQGASQGGGELASGSSLTPAQRAYYADLVGRELQDVTALWMAKLKSAESPALILTTRMANRLQEEAMTGEDDTGRFGNSSNSSEPRVTKGIISSEYRFSSSTHAANNPAASTSRPDSPTRIRPGVAVNVVSTGHRSPRSSPLKMNQVEFQESREALGSAHHSRQLRFETTNDFYHEGLEANQRSSALSDNNNSKAWVSSAHTLASSECSMSATGIRGRDHAIREVSTRLEHDGTSESRQHCEQRVPCHPKCGRQPIRRTQFLMEALSSDSSFVTELSSVWDDEILGSQVHGPFDNAVMERVQCCTRSRQTKSPSSSALQAATQARSSAERSPLSHRSVDSNGCASRDRSSLVSATSPTRGGWRRVSISRTSPYLQQLSPPQLPMSSAERHADLDVVVAEATREGKTTATALDKAEDADSALLLHERSLCAISLTVSPAAPCSSSRHMPEGHCPAHSAETGVDAAIPPVRLHTGLGEPFRSPLRPPTPLERDASTGDSAPAAASAVSAMSPTGEVAAEMQPGVAGDANVAPATPVSRSDFRSYKEEEEPQNGSKLSDTSSAANFNSLARQRAAFTMQQQRSFESHSVTEASCDLRQSSDAHISSEHHSPFHLSSRGDDITATGAADNSFTTDIVTASITDTTGSGVAGQEERACRVPMHDPASRQHRASSLSSLQPQASLASAHSSPTVATPRPSPAFATSCSTSARDGDTKCIPSQTTPAVEEYNDNRQHKHREMQPQQKAPLKEDQGHQESLRSPSAPSSTSLLAARNEDGRHSSRLSHTRISHAYNYEYKTIVCSDGQPHKRLILCKSACPSHSTHISHTHTGFVVPSSASQHTFSVPVTPRSISPTSSPSPSYPQHPVTAPIQLGADEIISSGFGVSPQHHERSDTHDAAEAQESRTSPLDIGTPLLAQEREERLSLTVPNTQPETRMVDDSRTSAEMPSTHSADGETRDFVRAASPGSRPASRKDVTDGPINAAAVDSEKEANAPAAAGEPQLGSPNIGRHRPFVFSGDVIQWWLDEDGVLSGRYYNPYRVQLPRADATAMKWCGPPVCNLRGAAPAAGHENGANLRQAALDSHTDRSAPAAAAVTLAAERNATMPTKALSKASSAPRMYSSAQSACAGSADIHDGAPRGWPQTRHQRQQHQQPPQSDMLQQRNFRLQSSHAALTAATVKGGRSQPLNDNVAGTPCSLRDGVVEADMVREGGTHARSVAARPSVRPTPVTRPRHRELRLDYEFDMFRRSAAAAVAAVKGAAASRVGVAGVKQQR